MGTTVLPDTTIWIDHFRAADRELIALLEQRRILLHPSVIAELALGSLKDRKATLWYLDHQPQSSVASLGEVRRLIEQRELYSRGLGLVDALILASVFITPDTLLWTRDRRLRAAAQDLGILADLL